MSLKDNLQHNFPNGCHVAGLGFLTFRDISLSSSEAPLILQIKLTSCQFFLPKRKIEKSNTEQNVLLEEYEDISKRKKYHYNFEVTDT